MDSEKIKGFTQKITGVLKKYKYAAAVVIVGLLLVMLAPSGKRSGGADNNSGAGGASARDAPEAGTAVFSVEEVEGRLKDVLGAAQGVGRVEVMLTLKSSTETIYAEESRASSRVLRDESTVYEQTKDGETNLKTVQQGGGSESPVVIKTICPEYMGAVIICDGADDAAVRGRVLSAVLSATGITSERVAILKMKA